SRDRANGRAFMPARYPRPAVRETLALFTRLLRALRGAVVRAGGGLAAVRGRAVTARGDRVVRLDHAAVLGRLVTPVEAGIVAHAAVVHADDVVLAADVALDREAAGELRAALGVEALLARLVQDHARVRVLSRVARDGWCAASVRIGGRRRAARAG